MQKVSYMGDGSTKEFYFNFPYFEDDNIIVTKNNINATGFCILGTSAGTDADIPYTGGKVVFDIAPTTLDNITIARSLPLTRVVDYQPLVKLNPTTLNQDMNYMMEIMKDFNDELETFSIRYSELAESESTAVFLSRITTINQNVNEKSSIAETSATNAALSATAAETAATSANSLWNQFNGIRTNCITEIPQDINLTLSSGTLTLKAGSKCYLKTDTTTPSITIASDLTTTQTTDGTYFAIYDGSALATVLTTTYNYSTLPSTYSLPLAIVTVSSGAISSIDQVFNGLGYIGSTVFALPGVKGLIPDGRNTDGTLKNTTFALSSVKTYTNTNAVTNTTGRIYADGTMLWSAVSDIYNPDTNYNMAGTTIDNACVFAYITSTTGGQITSFNPKIAFHAVDYNDSDYIANCAMPSSKYVDLTLGASWASYTMPADGYLFLDMSATAVNQYVKILNNTSGVGTSMTTQTNGFNLYIFLPVSKGDNVSVAYGSDLTKNKFRFIYANGAK